MNKVFIIAEAGVNHNGRLEIAKRLIDVAASSEVDAIKFQTWKTENIVSVFAKQADYQSKNTGLSETQFEMLKRLELSYDDFKFLKNYCDTKGIAFISTPDDAESAIFLSNLQEIFKIGSGAITNLPYLRLIGSLNKSIILSTGMSTLEEVKVAIETIELGGTPRSKITALQCTTEYPAPMEEVNLRAMMTIGHTLGVKVGYSDHTVGIETSIAAAALGASVIEKHFTLDKSMPGPDHKASIDPIELKEMVKAIRNIEVALGNGIKSPFQSEIKNRDVIRKSIVAKEFIRSGDTFSEENLICKRPGTGISPTHWYEVLGKKATRNFNPDELIEL